jgi:hypothetical protein
MASTRLQYRQALARALDDFEVYYAASGTSTTVVCSGLVNSSSNASAGRYNGRYVYISDGTGIGNQSVVKANGYAPSTGTLTIQETAWDTTPGVGSTVELTALFPALHLATIPSAQSDGTDYHSLINRALSMILVPDVLSVTTVADQQEYALSTYAYWLDRPSRLMGVLDPPRATGWPTKPTWRRWELQLDGGTPTLQFMDRAYPTSGATFELSVLRPADTLISGAESSSGLTSDTATAVPAVNDVVTIGLMFAYEALKNRNHGNPNGAYSKDWATQIGLARRVRGYDRSQETPEQQAAAPAGTEAA